MGNSLVVPLSIEAVLAATRIHDRLPIYSRTDAALRLLAERCPDFGPGSILLKVAAVNALYGTNLYAVDRMAQHIESVLRDEKHPKGAEFVELIAALPPRLEEVTKRKRRGRRHVSFASKFAHFFIDPAAFPIFDSYAATMVRFHLGTSRGIDPSGHRYATFVANFERLKREVSSKVTNRELDHYLWIAGQWRRWHKKPSSPINRELRALFESRETAALADLKIIRSAVSDRAR
jgi:hypothetical protein